MEYPVYLNNKSYNLTKSPLLKTRQDNHQADITKFSMLKHFVRSTHAKCMRWCFFLNEMTFYGMGVVVLFSFIVRCQNILNHNLLSVF